MSVVRGAARRRWASVAGALLVLGSLPALIGALPTSAETPGPAELRARILAADGAYAGYAESQGALGLPDLPEIGDVAALLGSRTRLRVWDAGPDRWRVDVLSPTGERGLYGTAEGTSTWDYERNLTVTLFGDPAPRLPRARDLVPAELGRRLLGGELRPGELTALPARRVAGVEAAGLRITPADGATTIAAVDIWADPATGLPVEVQVTGRGSTQADLVTRFLDLEQGPGAVDDSGVLAVPSPAGAAEGFATAPRISDFVDAAGRPPLPDSLAGLRRSDLGGDASPAVRTYGQGFTALAAVSLPGGLGESAFDAARAAGAQEVELTAGRGAVLTTPLLNLVIALPERGFEAYVLAGTVDTGLVLRAASGLTGAAERRVVDEWVIG